MSKEVLSLDCEGLDVSFKGKVYSLSPLKLKHQELIGKLTSEDQAVSKEAMYELLDDSGLPKEISLEIPMHKAVSLIEQLVGLSQKKS